MLFTVTNVFIYDSRTITPRYIHIKYIYMERNNVRENVYTRLCSLNIFHKTTGNHYIKERRMGSGFLWELYTSLELCRGPIMILLPDQEFYLHWYLYYVVNKSSLKTWVLSLFSSQHRCPPDWMISLSTLPRLSSVPNLRSVCHKRHIYFSLKNFLNEITMRNTIIKLFLTDFLHTILQHPSLTPVHISVPFPAPFQTCSSPWISG